MYKVIVRWYTDEIGEKFCNISPESDFYQELRCRAWPKTEEDVEKEIYKILDNMPENHYGKFQDQTTIQHILGN